MVKKMILGSALLLIWAGGAQAAELGISFSNKTAQLAVRQQVVNYQTGRAVFGVRGLYNKREDTELLSASYDILGPLGNTGLEIGAGASGYYVNSEPGSVEVGAGGIGVLVRFVPPGLPRATFRSSFYYCPEVFNGLDGESLWDAEASASFEIAPRANVFATYTEIETDIANQGSRTLDKSLRVGLSLGF